MKKRLLSLALALVMACGLLPVTASAAATVTQVVPYKYSEVYDFSEGLAVVRNGNGWGAIDATGKEVIPCGNLSYSVLDYGFHDGRLLVGNMDSSRMYGENVAFLWGYIDTTGKEVIPCTYPGSYSGMGMGYRGGPNGSEIDSALGRLRFHDGVAVWGTKALDKNGNEVVSSGKYDHIDPFSDGLAAVELNGKQGFIDTTGREVVSCRYNDVQHFSDGLAAVKMDGKWGYIDKTGKEVIPCQYGSTGAFENGRAVVTASTGEIANGKTVYAKGVIDKSGNVVVPFGQYKAPGGKYPDGLKAVQAKDGKWGFVDQAGNQIIPAKYDKSTYGKGSYYDASYTPSFSNGLAAVYLSGKGYGYIDLHGNEVLPFQYGEARQLSEGMLAVDLDGKWGFVRVEGLPIEPKPGQIKDTSQTQEDKKAQEAIITERREETAQERREKAIREQQNNPRYQEYLKANREFLAEHIEERDYIYTIVTDDIQNCSDEICAGLTTDAEKVLAIHKWVTENIYYDYPLLSQPHPWPTAQTVFDKKSYVCSGYTILFQALCWAQKIPCVSVAGPTTNGYHAWNAVQVDGEWSWVDATWDTFNKYYGGNQWIKGDQRMDYFRCSSEFLSTNRKATNSGSKITWGNNGEVITEYFWCYTTNGVNANLPDQSKEETQQIIEQSNKLLEEEKPLEERLAELAMENPTLSGWAKDEVVAAIKANLVPADLMDGYNTNITRQEFCSLMVMMLEQATEKKALDYIAEKGLTYQSPFTDTNLPTVGYAYTLGIVKGTGDTTFNPNGSITRQEAATMLGRVGRLLGLEAKSGTDFADRQDFPSWAVEGIAYVSGLTDPVSQKKVMEGTGGGFAPKGTYTREQGIITALRIFRCGN